MAYISKCEADLLALDCFELIGEDIKLGPNDHDWNEHRINLLSVLMLFPLWFNPLLILIELLLLLRGKLGLNLLSRFAQLFPDSSQPEKEGVYRGSWICEINNNANYNVTASKSVAVQGCLKEARKRPPTSKFIYIKSLFLLFFDPCPVSEIKCRGLLHVILEWLIEKFSDERWFTGHLIANKYEGLLRHIASRWQYTGTLRWIGLIIVILWSSYR